MYNVHKIILVFNKVIYTGIKFYLCSISYKYANKLLFVFNISYICVKGYVMNILYRSMCAYKIPFVYFIHVHKILHVFAFNISYILKRDKLYTQL